MTSSGIKTILEEHCKWLEDNKSGKCADLRGADLRGADLSETDLRWANFSDADLRGADLSETDLSNANLGWADISGVNLYYPIACPESGTFTAFKKAKKYIIKLEIPAEAKRSSATGRECRCDKARVISIENLDGSESRIKEVSSNYDKEFIYRVGEIVFVENFDENRWNECAPGIHFFITREEAVRYP